MDDVSFEMVGARLRTRIRGVVYCTIFRSVNQDVEYWWVKSSGAISGYLNLNGNLMQFK